MIPEVTHPSYIISITHGCWIQCMCMHALHSAEHASRHTTHHHPAACSCMPDLYTMRNTAQKWPTGRSHISNTAQKWTTGRTTALTHTMQAYMLTHAACNKCCRRTWSAMMSCMAYGRRSQTIPTAKTMQPSWKPTDAAPESQRQGPLKSTTTILKSLRST